MVQVLSMILAFRCLESDRFLLRTLDHSGSLRGALSAAQANQLSVSRMQSTCTSPLLHVKGFRDSVPLHGLADCPLVGVVVHGECEVSQQEVL